MAPLESIKKLGEIVLNESKDKTEWIIQSAKETEKKILSDAEKKGKENADVIIQDGKQLGEKERQKLLSTAEMEAKKQVLNSKEALIEETFLKARLKFDELKKTKKYKDILVSQIISSIVELDGKEFVVEAYEGENLKLTKEIVERINKDTKRKGLKLTLEEVSDDKGGVIVREKNGKVSIDNTFDSTIDRKRNEIRVRISEVLFE
jgi:V/A-type H+/Na+-transporting ATPase subunit E